MKKSLLLFAWYCCLHNVLSAQRITFENKAAGTSDSNHLLWSVKKTANRQESKFTRLTLNENEITDLYNASPQFITLQVPDENGVPVEAALALQHFAPARIKTNNNKYLTDIQLPLCYKGSVPGMARQHAVVFTIAPGYISMQALLPDKSIVIEKENSKVSNDHILYNSKLLSLPVLPFSCGLKGDEATSVLPYPLSKKIANKTAASFDKCVFVFIDCTDSLYYNRGSVQNTVNYIYSIWNDVRTAYAREQINISISEINVWTSSAPFITTTRELGIQTFAGYYRDNYWGNMAMLMDWSTNRRAAIAGGYGWSKGMNPGVCPNYNPNPVPGYNWGSFIYNDLNYFGNYTNYPTPSLQQQVYASVHEIGHLLGSHHTHWCGWPGGAIDNCAPVEGTCSAGPATSSGTFMSYCIGTGQFMDFNNGFGQLPGNTIRDFVDGNDCLNNCETCVPSTVVGAIPNPGNYKYEVSDVIIANGVINGVQTLVKLDGGNRVLLENGFKATAGSKVEIFNDGCGGIR